MMTVFPRVAVLAGVPHADRLHELVASRGYLTTSTDADADIVVLGGRTALTPAALRRVHGGVGAVILLDDPDHLDESVTGSAERRRCRGDCDE